MSKRFKTPRPCSECGAPIQSVQDRFFVSGKLTCRSCIDGDTPKAVVLPRLAPLPSIKPARGARVLRDTRPSVSDFTRPQEEDAP